MRKIIFTGVFVTFLFVVASQSASAQSSLLTESFDAGVPATWTLDAPISGVGWGVDATPGFVGDGTGPPSTPVDANPFAGAGSLNFNNGTDYTCPAPPSTKSSAPAIKLLSGDPRNAAALATSSAAPSRPSGTSDANCAFSSRLCSSV